jgi:hypothetical protein
MATPATPPKAPQMCVRDGVAPVTLRDARSGKRNDFRWQRKLRCKDRGSGCADGHLALKKVLGRSESPAGSARHPRRCRRFHEALVAADEAELPTKPSSEPESRQVGQSIVAFQGGPSGSN